MKVTICSAFRNSSRQLTRYFGQMEMLRRRLIKRGDSLSLVLGEGDHTDDTREKLPGYVVEYDAKIIHADHGGAEYGPVVDAQRFRQLAYVWDRIWQRIPASADVVVFLESDLIWRPTTMLALIDRTIEYPAVAPMIMDGPASFYDTYAFMLDGQNFAKKSPYHDALRLADWPVRLDSAGSCIAMRGALARKLKWTDEVIVGICAQIYKHDESVWLDPQLEVKHL